MDKNKKTTLTAYLRSSYRALLGVGVFSFVINALMLTYPLFMLQVYDRVLVSQSESTLIMLIIIAVSLLVVMGALEAIRSRVLIRVSGSFSDKASGRVFDAVYQLALKQPQSNPTQYLRDLDNVRQFSAGPGTITFFDLPWTPIYIGAVFLIASALGWLTVAGALIVLILAILNDRLTREPLKESNSFEQRANNYISTTLRNTEVLESMGMLQGFHKRWWQMREQSLALQAKSSDRGSTIIGISKSFRLILQVLVLAIGAFLVLDFEITAGMMIAASIIASRGLAPIDQALNVWKQFVSARESYKRLNALLASVPEAEEKMPLPPPEGKISVNDAYVVAPGAKDPLLKKITFGLQAGELMGLVGPSGSGKSSLARALVGVWPVQAGNVRLDGADVFQWDAQQLGQYIGYLPQDVELFDGTVAENIARFPTDPIPPEQVVEAAELAGVHEMILALPDGYETQIGVDGSALSGGQRQRIALARAVYGKPRFVVLDEPNSNLDDEGDQALKQSLLKMKQAGTTAIIISHRPAVMSVVDKLLVLSGGMVQKFGPTKEVIKDLMPPSAQKPQQAQPAPKSVQATAPAVAPKAPAPQPARPVQPQITVDGRPVSPPKQEVQEKDEAKDKGEEK